MTIDSVSSTNDLAREYAQAGAPHGSLFIGITQSSGRGRWSRPWASSPGGLFLSALVRPKPPLLESMSLIPLSVAAGVARAVASCASIDVHAVWPNDLYVDDKKVGGILCESIVEGDLTRHVVLGIGINANQPPDSFPRELRSRAVSLASLTGELVDEQELALAVVLALEQSLDRESPTEGLVEWRRRARGINGWRVRVTPHEGTSYEATTCGVNDEGALMIRMDDGAERLLYSEDVRLLGSWRGDR
jgi:BirA family biotin operon repressor/biotin-[acetyl-CoA-carboxylase] ligase